MPKTKAPPVKTPEPAAPVAKPSRAKFLEDINRTMLTLLEMHKRCRDPRCKRMRRCAGYDFRCQRDFPLPPLTPEEDAQVRAEMYFAIKAEMARRGMKGA